MNDFWKDKFPKDKEEAKKWKPITRYAALDQFVMVVAQSRIEGAWACYIGAVLGYDHEQEFQGVLHKGTKLRESTALELFPSFESVPYAY